MASMKSQLLSGMVIAGIFAAGCFVGAFLNPRSAPHVSPLFTTCASAKQFVAEFRIGREYLETIDSTSGTELVASNLALEVDGKNLGPLHDGDPIRYFLCEGNHRARVSYGARGGETEMREFDFALSRPSLFDIWQGSDDRWFPRKHEVRNSLSPYEPDDLKARIYPPEETR
jgi:hypothetical protein